MYIAYDKGIKITYAGIIITSMSMSIYDKKNYKVSHVKPEMFRLL